MKKIYIASPYTLGDVAVNVRKQMDAADELISIGYAPFIPLLYHFQHLVYPEPYSVWTEIDNAFVLSCDAVLRLPGESRGADAEVKIARENNIPVAYSIGELVCLMEQIKH